MVARCGGTWFVTNLGFSLAAGSSWQTAHFSIAAFDVTRVAGTDSYATTFGTVGEMRLLDNPSLDFHGVPIVATLLVDNVTAVPEPAATGLVFALIGILMTSLLRRHTRLTDMARPGPIQKQLR
jgi:hypothetical protein